MHLPNFCLIFFMLIFIMLSHSCEIKKIHLNGGYLIFSLHSHFVSYLLYTYALLDYWRQTLIVTRILYLQQECKILERFSFKIYFFLQMISTQYTMAPHDLFFKSYPSTAAFLCPLSSHICLSCPLHSGHRPQTPFK